MSLAPLMVWMALAAASPLEVAGGDRFSCSDGRTLASVSIVPLDGRATPLESIGEQRFALPTSISVGDYRLEVRFEGGESVDVPVAVRGCPTEESRFEFDSAVLHPGDIAALRAAVECWGGESPGFAVGWADPPGPGPYNDSLSLKRARAVRRVTSASAVQVIGVGEGEQRGDGARDPEHRRVLLAHPDDCSIAQVEFAPGSVEVSSGESSFRECTKGGREGLLLVPRADPLASDRLDRLFPDGADYPVVPMVTEPGLVDSVFWVPKTERPAATHDLCNAPTVLARLLDEDGVNGDDNLGIGDREHEPDMAVEEGWLGWLRLRLGGGVAVGVPEKPAFWGHGTASMSVGPMPLGFGVSGTLGPERVASVFAEASLHLGRVIGRGVLVSAGGGVAGRLDRTPVPAARVAVDFPTIVYLPLRLELGLSVEVRQDLSATAAFEVSVALLHAFQEGNHVR